ncbi:MAG: hypothetical protein ACRDSH_24200, partial [Pseudonocardiaceae bacterium]
ELPAMARTLVGVWTSVGYFAGGHLTTMYQEFPHYRTAVLLAVTALVLAVGMYWLWRRQRESDTATHR